MKRTSHSRVWNALLSSLLVIQTLVPSLPVHASGVTLNSAAIDTVTSNSAAIRVSVSGGAYIRLEYGPSQPYALFAPIGSTATRASTSWYINSTPWYMTFNLSNLSAQTTYHYRVGVCPLSLGASCITDLSQYVFNADQVFTTTVAVDTYPPAQVVGLSVSDISTSTVRLSWTSPADPDANSNPQAAVRYEVRYRQSSSVTNDNWSSSFLAVGTQTPQAPGTTESLALTGLSPSSTYYFAVKAFDSANNVSPLSSPASGTTLTYTRPDTSAPERVTNVSVMTTTDNSATLHFFAPRDTDGEGASISAMRYEIRHKGTYSSNEAEWWPTAVPHANPPAPQSYGTQEFITLSGLTPSTSYYFSIKAFDAAGNGSSFSLPLAVRTLDVSQTGTQGTFPSGTARLDVTVKNAQGMPISNATVGLTSAGSCATPPSTTAYSASGLTSVSGLYAFPPIQAGTYTLGVTPPAERTDLSLQANICVTLVAGQTTTREVILSGTPNQQITPSAINLRVAVSAPPTQERPSGGPLQGALISLRNAGQCVPAGVMTTMDVFEISGTADSNGAHNFSNLNRKYLLLTVTPPSNRTDLMTMNAGCVTLVAGQNNQTVMMPVSSAVVPIVPKNGNLGSGTATLTVVAKDQNGSPLPGAQIGLSTSGMCPGQVQSPGSWANGSANAAGTYVFSSIPAGIYTLGVSGGPSRVDLVPATQICITVSENASVSQNVTLNLLATPLPQPVAPSAPTASGMYVSNQTQTTATAFFMLDKPGMARVEYTTAPTNAIWTVGAPYTFTSVSSTHSIPLNGLVPGTMYWYRIATTGSSGGSSMTFPNAGYPTFTTSPTQVLAQGSSRLTVILTDSSGQPIEGATVGLSSCSSPTASYSSGNTPYQPCSWQTGVTAQLPVSGNPESAGAGYQFTGLESRQYTLGISPPPGRYMDFDTITDYAIPMLADTEQRIVRVALKKRSTTSSADLPIMDPRATVSPSGDSAWISWQTPSESSGQLAWGTTQSYEGGSRTYSEFRYAQQAQISLTGGTTIYYKITATDRNGRSGMYMESFARNNTGIMPVPTMPFAVNTGRSYPNPGMTHVPLTLPSVRIQFTRQIEPSSLQPGALSIVSLDKKQSAQGVMQAHYDTASYILNEPLKPQTTYLVTVRGSIRDVTGVSLGADQFIQFTTVSGSEQTGAGALTGVVKLLDGAPVAGTELVLRSRFGEQRAISNAQGDYSFTNLPTGEYGLEAFPPERMGGYRSTGMAKISISEANFTKYDIVLMPTDFIIDGSVVYEDGTPVTDAQVGAYRVNGSEWMHPIRVDAQGRYRLSVSPGQWTVNVSQWYGGESCNRYSSPCPMGFGQLTTAMPTIQPDWIIPAPQELSIDPSEKNRSLTFTVKRRISNSSLTGTILRSDGRAPEPGSVHIRIEPRASLETFSKFIEVSADGAFATLLPPGRWALSFFIQDDEQSAPLPLEFIVLPGEQKNVGVITIQKASLSISGTVQTSSANPASGMRVEAWNAETRATVSSVTDAKGFYRLPVSRGDWTVYLPPTDRFSSQTNMMQTVPRTKLPAEHVDFTVTENGSFITGTIKDSDGILLTDASGFVRVKSKKHGYPLMGSPVTKGEFRLPVSAGSYLLELDIPQNSSYLAPEPQSIKVRNGETTQVAFIVRKQEDARPGMLSGQLTDRRGNPIIGVPFTMYASQSKTSWMSKDGDTSSGTYTLSLSPGTWHVGYDIKDPQFKEAANSRGREVKIKPSEEKKLNLVAVRQDVILEGFTKDGDGNVLPNIPVMISSEPFIGKSTTFQDAQWAYSDSRDGSFSFNVEPGTYFVRSFISESSDLINPDEQKVVASVGDNKPLSLVFRQATVLITGKTRVKGKPVNARVWAWSNKGGYKQELSDDGEFELPVSLHDTWRISAIADVNRCVYKATETPLSLTKTSDAVTLDLDLFPLNVCLPEPIAVTGDAAQPIVAENAGGVKVAVPANATAVEGDVNLSITPEITPASLGNERVIGSSYDVRMRSQEGVDIRSFNTNLIVSLPYDNAELRRLNVAPEKLNLKYWDSASWQPVENIIIDRQNMLITGSVRHLTRFAITAPSQPLLAPKAPKASVALSGSNVSISLKKPNDSSVAYFKLYRSTVPGQLGRVIATNTAKNSISDISTKKGVTYYYTSRSVSKDGVESENMRQLKITVGKKK